MAEPTVIKDPIYSFEIARRAVGRAALHLGVDSMTEQALDVMADVLLQYLSRTGRALSHLAESSRRPSAHVNVLDAFQACQLVTAPAVGRLHLQGEEEDDLMATTPNAKPAEGDGSPNGTAHGTPAGSPAPTNGGTGTNGAAAAAAAHSATSWKGLAAFCFGPNWLHEKDEDEYLQELAAKNAANASNGEAARELSSAGGGKVFPTSVDDEEGGDAGAGDMGTRRRKTGWEAPFPDEIPAFPKASATCANPHALPARVTGGLTSSASNSSSMAYRKVDVDAAEAEDDEQETLDELEALSDGVFLPSSTEEPNVSAAGDVGWGSIDGKRKRTREDGDVEMEAAAASSSSSSPQTKKIKFQDGTKAGAEGGATKTAGATTSPAPDQEDFTYIPSFYPKPPSTKVLVDDRRTVVDAMDDRQERLLQQQRTQEQQEQQVFASNHDLDATASTTALRDGMNLDSNRGIRSSLIRLGNHSSYWGSGWDKASSSSSSSSAQTLAVPMGRKVGGPTAPGGKTTPDDPIIPMSRASGSRVSRVLEGSMDAAAMQ